MDIPSLSAELTTGSEFEDGYNDDSTKSENSDDSMDEDSDESIEIPSGRKVRIVSS